MQIRAIKKLTKGEKVFHKQLGVCSTIRVEKAPSGRFQGLVIIPDTKEGQGLLKQWYDFPEGTPFTEEQVERFILNKVPVYVQPPPEE